MNKTEAHNAMTADVEASSHHPGGGGGTTTANGANALPKCVCTWKNCRAYQKAFREAKHEVYDGVIKIKFAKDQPESMALKASIDRCLGVSAETAKEWKAAKKSGQPDTVKYTIARHHFTEKHVRKYLSDPKGFSFLKPFSVHGAKKYLYTVNNTDVLPAANGSGEEFYLQVPNVPKEVVKAEFHHVMETLKNNKKVVASTTQAGPSSQSVRKKTYVPVDEKSSSAALQNKELENKMLKDQLDAMKGQLTFLHDMVQKLQEQHFDQQSVSASKRSRRMSARHGGGRSGVPAEIELGEGHGGGSYWNEGTEGDWTDHYGSESNREDETEDDAETTGTFQVTYKQGRRDSGSCSVHSKAASTIVSASKSVKTLPREIELDEDEDDSDTHESLEEEAFDNRSFASSHYGRSSFVGDSLRKPDNMDKYNTSRNSRGPSAMKGTDRKSLGPGAKKPSRRSSADSTSRRIKSDDDAGTYEVTAMMVTDPYGEKGSYTGSISRSTGMPNGYGRLEYDKAGRWYEGDWKHGRWTGRGRLSNGDGDFYEGGLKNDHKHGRGIMKFADGRIFEGEYINGQMVEGKMTYQDGSTYSGSWVDGMRHGRGICVFTDESMYEGEFKEGEFYGRGKMTWNDGGWYEGEWVNGEMHGRGREVRSDGSLRHDGEWIKGQPIRKK